MRNLYNPILQGFGASNGREVYTYHDTRADAEKLLSRLKRYESNSLSYDWSNAIVKDRGIDFHPQSHRFVILVKRR